MATLDRLGQIRQMDCNRKDRLGGQIKLIDGWLDQIDQVRLDRWVVIEQIDQVDRQIKLIDGWLDQIDQVRLDRWIVMEQIDWMDRQIDRLN